MYQKYKTYEQFRDGLFSQDPNHSGVYYTRYKTSIKRDDCTSIRIKQAGVYREPAVRKYWNIYNDYFQNSKSQPNSESDDSSKS
jgi:hypothetical protein